MEYHEPAIGGKVRGIAIAIALRAVTGHRHARGAAGHQIAHEDVICDIGVARDEIAGRGVEYHEPAIGGKVRGKAIANALRAVTGHRHARGAAGHQIAHEDVICDIGVARDEIAGTGVEHHEPAIGGKVMGKAAGIALRAVTGHRYTRDRCWQRCCSRGYRGSKSHRINPRLACAVRIGSICASRQNRARLCLNRQKRCCGNPIAVQRGTPLADPALTKDIEH